MQGVPDKGRLLTEISAFWFARLQHLVPNHVLSTDVRAMPDAVQPHAEKLEGRTMLVRKAQVVPLEAIVRGYLTGTLFSRFLCNLHRSALQGAAGRSTRNPGLFMASHFPLVCRNQRSSRTPFSLPRRRRSRGRTTKIFHLNAVRCVKGYSI
jgi:hypothetical protein